MNIQKRDRFELLSAYLDGEVTSTEKRQVEEWLDNDAETQKLYERLLALRQNFQALPVPSNTQSVEQTIQQVFGKIEKRRQHRSWRWGGAAAAALIVATLSSVVPGRQVLQMADVSNPPNTEEKLLVALNTPLVELPEITEPQKIQPNKPQ